MRANTEKHKLTNLLVCLIDKVGRLIWVSNDPLHEASKPGTRIVDTVIPEDAELVLEALGRCMLRQEQVEYSIVGQAAPMADGKNAHWRIKLLPASHGDLAAVGVCYKLAENIVEFPEDEQEIARLLAADLTLKEIAEKLYLSDSTIDTKMRHLKAKLGVKNIGGLVACAILHGLI